jgi:uncharacterized protein YndB with AHSA1/START domain
MSVTASAVEQEIRIGASPETVFAFFTDPEKMVRWKGREAKLDATPGGAYRVVISDRAVAAGKYVELDPPRRVVFTWGWEGAGSAVPPGSSTVEVDLTPDGDGTLLRLVHRDLPEDEREQHRHGWAHFLPRLQKAATGEDPGPDPYGTA